MIGIIITGHGTFASGLDSAIKLIAGEQDACLAVDFSPEQTNAQLGAELEQAITTLQPTCEEIIICTDIIGGAPFHQANILAAQKEHCHVISGTNLPVLLEALFSRLALDATNLINILKESHLARLQVH